MRLQSHDSARRCGFATPLGFDGARCSFSSARGPPTGGSSFAAIARFDGFARVTLRRDVHHRDQ